MKKIILLIAMMIIFAINTSAQITYSVHTGYKCWLAQVNAISSFDKDPLDGSSKFDAGISARGIFFYHGISGIGEVRYIKGRSAALLGVGVNLLNNKKIIPSLEIMGGFGEQLRGLRYQADANGNTMAIITYDRDFLCFQAEAALNIEVPLNKRWSLVASGGVIYRSQEGEKDPTETNVNLGNSNVTQNEQALELKSQKFIPKVSIGIRFRIK